MVTAAIGRTQGVSHAGPAAALGVDPAMEQHLFRSPSGRASNRSPVARISQRRIRVQTLQGRRAMVQLILAADSAPPSGVHRGRTVGGRTGAYRLSTSGEAPKRSCRYAVLAIVKGCLGTRREGTLFDLATTTAFFSRSEDPMVSPVVCIKPGKKTMASTMAGRPTKRAITKA